jgi:hypothetical protein
MKTPNQIINDIQNALIEETTKGVYSNSVLKIVDILHQVQTEAWNEAIEAAKDIANNKGWDGNQSKRCDDYEAGHYDCANAIASVIYTLKRPTQEKGE